MRNPYLSTAAWLLLCGSAACDSTTIESHADANGGLVGTDEERRKFRDAGTSSTPDAAPPPTSSGTVTCYLQATPDATCASPDHCCFSNYDAHHNGTCTTASCSWGTIACDGPEDCGSGGTCCSNQISDPDEGTQGYDVACQASACGAPPSSYEICHAGGSCSNGRTCMSAFAAGAYQLPRTLYVCN